MVYLVILFLIFFFILAWRRLDLAVMILIAALPAYLIRFKIFGLPSTLLEVMIWAVFLVWFFRSYKGILNNVKLKARSLLKNDKNKLKISDRYPFDWEIVVLLLVALIAVATADFTDRSFGIWKAYFFEPALFFIVIVNIIAGKNQAGEKEIGQNSDLLKRLEIILWPLAVGALAVALVAIFQKLTGALIDNPAWAAAETRRVVSFFGYPNAVGLYLGPIILVLLGWLSSTVKNFQFSIFPPKADPPAADNFQTFFNEKMLKTNFIALVIFLSILSIYFAKSKGAMLGVAAGLIIFGLLGGKKARRLTMALVLAAAIGLTAYQPARELAVSNLTFINKSGQIRQAGWVEAWKMLKDGRLITGAGLANYQAAVAPYHPEGFFIKNNDPDWLKKIRSSAEYRQMMWQPLEIYLYPHNIWLNFWSELGLAGLLLFVWLIGKYLYWGIFNFQFSIFKQIQNSTRLEVKYLSIGLVCAMVVILVHGWVDVPYFKNDLAVIFWLLLATMGVINRFNKKIQTPLGAE